GGSDGEQGRCGGGGRIVVPVVAAALEAARGVGGGGAVDPDRRAVFFDAAVVGGALQRAADHGGAGHDASAAELVRADGHRRARAVAAVALPDGWGGQFGGGHRRGGDRGEHRGGVGGAGGL